MILATACWAALDGICVAMVAMSADMVFPLAVAARGLGGGSRVMFTRGEPTVDDRHFCRPDFL